MQLGTWDIVSCLAGRFGLDGGAMFGVVPKTLWEKRLPPDARNRVPMAMRCMLARGQGRTILVDVGSGTAQSDKDREIYDLHDVGRLPEALAARGVSADEVTDVVLTHLHFDHGAGIAEPDEDGWSLVFPRARHHVQASQWEHAFHPNPRDKASYYQDRLAVMESGGVLDLHDGPWTLCDGFELFVFDGHTPGQQLPRVGGDGGAVFFCGDLIPTQHHLPTPYIMAYDLDPVLAMGEKVGILERALKEDWILFFEHDARMEACRVESDGKRVRPSAPLAFD